MAKRPSLSKDQVKRLRKHVVAETAERAHAALVATVGISRAPSVKKCAKAIRNCMKWAHHKDYLDEDYFHWEGMLIHVERGRGPLGDTFTVYVPATGGYFWARKDMGRKDRQTMPKTGRQS